MWARKISPEIGLFIDWNILYIVIDKISKIETIFLLLKGMNMLKEKPLFCKIIKPFENDELVEEPKDSLRDLPMNQTLSLEEEKVLVPYPQRKFLPEK